MTSVPPLSPEILDALAVSNENEVILVLVSNSMMEKPFTYLERISSPLLKSHFVWPEKKASTGNRIATRQKAAIQPAPSHACVE